MEGRVVDIAGWLDADAVPELLERCIAAATGTR
jgi:hypothetical protein